MSTLKEIVPSKIRETDGEGGSDSKTPRKKNQFAANAALDLLFNYVQFISAIF